MTTDVQGNTFKVGQTVAVASKLYATDGLHVVVKAVTRVDGNKVYLNNSPQPLKYPARVCILAS